jgi:hypothetical protein
MQKIVPIVEGDGEVDAAPRLITRILNHYNWSSTWYAGKAIRAGNPGYFKKNIDRFLRVAELEADCSGILILFDLEDACPKQEAEHLAQEIQQLQLIYPTAVVFAHREYEVWFLASLHTMAGSFGLPQDIVCDRNIETIRDVKGWISKQMPKKPQPQIYKPTFHQAEMTKLIDVDAAIQASRSFRRLVHAIEEIVTTTELGIVTPRVLPPTGGPL